MYKYAAEELKDLSVDAQKVFFKPETVPEEIKYYEEPIRPEEIVGDITLEKLNQIFRMVMRRKKDREDPVRSHFGKIQKEKYKVEDRMDDIRRQIRGLKKINFRTLLDIQPVKEMVIVTFLAVLELMKVGEIKVNQEHNFAEIYLDSSNSSFNVSSSMSRTSDNREIATDSPIVKRIASIIPFILSLSFIIPLFQFFSTPYSQESKYISAKLCS